MMWLVRIALRYPYTFVVMSLLILLFGGLSVVRMPTDIFPVIDIPVVAVVWGYGGLPPVEMEQRIVSGYERTLTTTVNDIEHTESLTLTGVSVIKVFFQPNAKIDVALSQVTAISQTVLRNLPPGATPPLIMEYSASNAPILQTALASDSLSEQEMFDLATNTIRPELVTVNGIQIPWPYGGKQRQITVDIDPARLYPYSLSPRDVTNALNLQNVVLPTGTAKMGANEYPILLNGTPEIVAEIGALPVKTVGDRTVFLRDLANVRDGYSPQTNMVHVDGKRSVLMSVLKNGGASTLDVVAQLRAAQPRILPRIPKSLSVSLLFDQSVFVRSAVEGVVREAAIAAGLTALMLMLFLGSWRSTLIVLLSIPLSILVSIILLGALGETLNVMTLGGMALAVGILVDDATVEIENVHRNMAQKKPMIRAILDGAQEIATPAFVSTLCICIVFVPVAFISGAAKFLFVPMALAVVFAMLTSYLLSRTLVPTMMRYLLQKEAEPGHQQPRWFQIFNAGFDRLRGFYGQILSWVLHNRLAFITAFIAGVIGSMLLLRFVGRDFFPQVDAGLIKLHIRCPPGTRIEESEQRFALVENTIHDVIPANEVDNIIDNIGIPYSGINLALSDGSAVSPADGEILIALKKDHHPTAGYVRAIRSAIAQDHPDLMAFFLAPDISTQVLNFGISAPIDVQVVARTPAEGEATAKKLAARISRVPGAVDVHVAQTTNVPYVRVNVNRTMAAQNGLTEHDVATDLLISLASSGQVSPGFWLDPKRGFQYLVAVQTPQYQNNSFDSLAHTPISTSASNPQLLSNVASLERVIGPANITHFNGNRSYDVQANVDGIDLGYVADQIRTIVDDSKSQFPPGTIVHVKGQVESMNASFYGLGLGLILAVALVYLLMVVNFQSWVDPLIILMALPGAAAGIAWMLFVTRTPLSVPALMGAMMCVGVATANSILVISFAKQLHDEGQSALESAFSSAMTRLRPVLMTALAMILGMLPMSLGLGDGGEQNAPLGRAVIGGLAFATLSTLFFVPVMYTLLGRRTHVDTALNQSAPASLEPL